MQVFRDLVVWQKSHEIVLSVYRVTERFPKTETYGITSPLRRAIASVPMNIAEGCGRGSGADFGRFLQIAIGSASEAKYQLLLSRDLGYLDTKEWTKLTEAIGETMKMLTSLRNKLR